MKIIAVVALLLVASACSSVNIRTDGNREETRPPTFQKSHTYWWWGLRGKHSINVREVCAGRPVVQMQAVSTITNVLGSALTLGIYSPRTARVWCGEVQQ